MKSNHDPEERIVWVRPEVMDVPVRYVREGVAMHSRRRGPIRFKGLVAYAEVVAGGGPYMRRFWWLAEHDPYPRGEGFPCEAVLPRSIRPNRESRPPRELTRALNSSL